MNVILMTLLISFEAFARSSSAKFVKLFR